MKRRPHTATGTWISRGLEYSACAGVQVAARHAHSRPLSPRLGFGVRGLLEFPFRPKRFDLLRRDLVLPDCTRDIEKDAGNKTADHEGAAEIARPLLRRCSRTCGLGRGGQCHNMRREQAAWRPATRPGRAFAATSQSCSARSCKCQESPQVQKSVCQTFLRYAYLTAKR